MRNVHQEIKSTLLWIALVTVLALVGFWQAKVVIARDLQAGHQNLPPPIRTRVAIRPPPRDFTGDVVEDYIARCVKGVTDAEIRWIVADFRNAGLDQLPDSPLESMDQFRSIPNASLFKLRLSQQRWYLDALSDTFHLTDKQKIEASAKLTELYQTEKAAFNAKWADSTTPEDSEEQEDRKGLITSTSWLFDMEAAYLPWNLCDLDHEQVKLTWKEWFDMTKDGRNSDRSLHDPATDNSIFLLPEPSDFNLVTDFEGRPVPGMLFIINPFLPLVHGQIFLEEGNSFDDTSKELQSNGLDNIRRLHSAQLKILLLFHPKFAEEIRLALGEASH